MTQVRDAVLAHELAQYVGDVACTRELKVEVLIVIDFNKFIVRVGRVTFEGANLHTAIARDIDSHGMLGNVKIDGVVLEAELDLLADAINRLHHKAVLHRRSHDNDVISALILLWDESNTAPHHHNIKIVEGDSAVLLSPRSSLDS